MKKAYVKPVLLMETFEPSDAIAGSCDIDVRFSDTNPAHLCSYNDEFSGVNLFNHKGVCEYLWNDGDDKGCYHIPAADGQKYFGS